MFKEHFEEILPGQRKQKEFRCKIDYPKNSKQQTPTSINGQLISCKYVLQFMAVTKTMLVFNKEHSIDFDIYLYENQEKTPVSQNVQAEIKQTFEFNQNVPNQ